VPSHPGKAKYSIRWHGAEDKILEGELPELTIIPGAPYKIHTEDFPSTIPNGGTLSFTAELRDMFDNLCTNATDKLGVNSAIWCYNLILTDNNTHTT